MIINDYIRQGYRAYKLSELPVINLVRCLPRLQRINKLEILIVDEVVFVKTTYKYDQPKNPYI